MHTVFVVHLHWADCTDAEFGQVGFYERCLFSGKEAVLGVVFEVVLGLRLLGDDVVVYWGEVCFDRVTKQWVLTWILLVRCLLPLGIHVVEVSFLI